MEGEKGEKTEKYHDALSIGKAEAQTLLEREYSDDRARALL